jgi:hypothetical protein
MPTLIAPVPEGTSGAAGTRGVLFVHACPRAFSPHVEWAIAAVLQREVSLTWSPQPVLPGSVRAELTWYGPSGTAAHLVTALRNFTGLRYEATEDPTASHEGERFSVTPSLGVFRATVGVHGDVLVSEDRLRAAMSESMRKGTSLRESLEGMLGSQWDAELEPFRYAGEGAPVRYLHRVG